MARADHPKRDVLQGFLWNALEPRQSRKIAWHLARCSECQSWLRHEPGGRDLIERLFSDIPSYQEAGADYSLVIAQSYDRLVEREAALQQGRELAPALLADLRRHPRSRQRVLARNARRFVDWALADLLLDSAARTWSDDPPEADHLAELALIVADRLGEPDLTPAILSDLRARAWAHLGNTRRILSDLHGAQDAFTEALRHLAAGSRDPAEEAGVLRLHARLLRDLRRLEEAHATLDRVVTLRRRCGDRHQHGLALLAKANVFQDQDEIEQAIATLGRAVELLDAERYPGHALGARHNLANYLIDAGRFMEAQAILVHSRDLYRRHADLSLRMRYHWVRGRAATGLGQFDRAERYLLRARDTFLDHRAPYEAAEVSLELAQVYAGQGRHADVERLAQETLEVFQPLGLERETMAALILFHEAAEAERASAALLAELVTRLRRRAT